MVVNRWWVAEADQSSPLERITKENKNFTFIFSRLLKRINVFNGEAVLTDESFQDLLEKISHSDDPVVIEALSTLFMTAKLIYGPELHRIERERAEKKEAEAKFIQQIFQKELRLMAEVYEIKEEREKEKETCINRKRELMYKINSRKYRLDDFIDQEKEDVKVLLQSRHLKRSLFGTLKVMSMENIPADKTEDYYDVAEHPASISNPNYPFSLDRAKWL